MPQVPRLDIIAAYTNRFVQVSMTIAPVRMSIVAKFLDMPWDSLRVLSFSTPANSTIHVPLDFASFSQQPPPHLDVLLFSDVFPWSLRGTPMYRNLRILEMNHCYGTDFYRPSMDQFLEILESCSLLERMSFILSGPKSFAQSVNRRPPPKRMVTLAHD